METLGWMQTFGDGAILSFVNVNWIYTPLPFQRTLLWPSPTPSPCPSQFKTQGKSEKKAGYPQSNLKYHFQGLIIPQALVLRTSCFNSFRPHISLCGKDSYPHFTNKELEA